METTINYSKTKISESGRQYIRAAAPVWVDGIKASEKVGFVEVQPEAADKALARFVAGELGVEFLGYNQLTGNYNVEVRGLNVAATQTAATLEHTA